MRHLIASAVLAVMTVATVAIVMTRWVLIGLI